jgi:hypothetical protein
LNVSSGSIGLYSFTTGLIVFTSGSSYVAESFYDLLTPGGKGLGIEDSFENAVFDPTIGSVPGLTLAKFSEGYSTALSSIDRFMLVSSVTGPGVALASAGTESSARKFIGSINTAATSTVSFHIFRGQLGYCFVDLTGGHAAAAAGDALYLSQTVPGKAQSDKPLSGIVKQVGIAFGASDGTGLTLVLLVSSGGAGGTDFFELNLAFGGASPVIPPSSTFNMPPASDAATVSSGLAWEWECPFNTTGMDMWVNVLTFSGTALSFSVTKNGGSSGFTGIAGVAATGLFHAAQAVAVAAGATIGVEVSSPSGTTANFTVRLRLT